MKVVLTFPEEIPLESFYEEKTKIKQESFS